jgi:hypothetical protein
LQVFASCILLSLGEDDGKYRPTEATTTTTILRGYQPTTRIPVYNDPRLAWNSGRTWPIDRYDPRYDPRVDSRVDPRVLPRVVPRVDSRYDGKPLKVDTMTSSLRFCIFQSLSLTSQGPITTIAPSAWTRKSTQKDTATCKPD